jgi:5-(carboxyamino)imidazole ribonucleotide synthase
MMTRTDPSNLPVVGIVGAGQLARMMYQAAIPLGIRVRVLAGRPDEAAALVARDVSLGSPHSAADLTAFAEQCDVVTFDHELVDASAIAATGRMVWPSAATVAVAQDKIEQRTLFARHGFPVPTNRPVDTPDEVAAFGAEAGWPVVLKAAQGGYDGRGVWVLDAADHARALVPILAKEAGPLLAEQWVAIEREIAVLVARRPSGQMVTYPVVETVQRDGICHQLRVPAPISDELASRARRLASDVAEAVGAVGIMALELFVTGGELIVNEIAVRPHNSGHFSIEGAVTSQFEQHLRAVLDWPLGETALTAPAVVTVNLLGGIDGRDPREQLPAALAIPGLHVHLYGKTARPGRKLGHVTTLGSELAECEQRAWQAAAILIGAAPNAMPR